MSDSGTKISHSSSVVVKKTGQGDCAAKHLCEVASHQLLKSLKDSLDNFSDFKREKKDPSKEAQNTDEFSLNEHNVRYVERFIDELYKGKAIPSDVKKMIHIMRTKNESSLTKKDLNEFKKAINEIKKDIIINKEKKGSFEQQSSSLGDGHSTQTIGSRRNIYGLIALAIADVGKGSISVSQLNQAFGNLLDNITGVQQKIREGVLKYQEAANSDDSVFAGSQKASEAISTINKAGMWLPLAMMLPVMGGAAFAGERGMAIMEKFQAVSAFTEQISNWAQQAPLKQSEHVAEAQKAIVSGKQVEFSQVNEVNVRLLGALKNNQKNQQSEFSSDDVTAMLKTFMQAIRDEGRAERVAVGQQ